MTVVKSYGQVAREVGGYASAKVMGLQRRYLAQDASARATLARLRRLDTPGGGYWMMTGEDLFSGIPDWGSWESRALLSIKSALKLYAIHQQSVSQGVAVSGAEWPAGSFGYACSRISSGPNGNGAQGVRRRMAGIEAAEDLSGVETYMRALVRLMRNATEHLEGGLPAGRPVRLDYGRLATDLFLIQSSEHREQVFLRWARDYYRYTSMPEDTKSQQEQGVENVR